MTTLQERAIKCVDCGVEFTFTVGEQAFYAEHGLTNAPTRCKPCRQKRKGARPDHAKAGATGGPARPGPGGGAARPMFPAVCSDCGTETMVPFKASGDRPVYCRDCYEARKHKSDAGRERHASPSGASRAGHAQAPHAARGGPRTQGAVKSFNEAKGFGFILADGGEEIFVHFSAIAGEGFRSLTRGDRVEFDTVEGPKGKQAVGVVKI